MIRTAIIGASGYTGAESIRILLKHPEVKLTYLTALPEECGKVSEIFPEFKGRCEMNIEPLDLSKLHDVSDVVLCCLPHKVSMGFVPKLLAAGQKVVDFSADYRLKDIGIYEKFYQVEHSDTENVKRAAYGLPELFRDEIEGKDLVANPGCFPTGAILAIAPLLKQRLIDPSSIIVSAVTGISGAGNKPMSKFHFPNMNDNLFPYGVGTHRHMPEMEQLAALVSGQKYAQVLFQPHAGPFDRGILSAIYTRPDVQVASEQLTELYHDFYASEPFVQVCSEAPAVKDVAHTNHCHVYPTVVKDTVVCFSAIDNLVKGASGQAIQNMNLIFGLEETLGLW